MLTEAGSDYSPLAGSGRDRSGKPDHTHTTNAFSPHPLATEAELLTAGESSNALPQGRTPLVPRPSFAGIPTLSPQVATPDALTRALQRVNLQVERTLSDQVTPLRLAGHLSVLMIAAVVLVLSQITIPEWELSLQPTPSATASATGALSAGGQQKAGFFDSPALTTLPVLTILDKKVQPTAPRQDIAYYTVKAGDTVLGIAAKYNLQPETLMWSNSIIEQNPDRLSIGDELRILPVDGVLHVVKPGETLSDLATEYEIDMQDIVAYAGNGLESASVSLPIGKELVIPGGTRAFVGPSSDMAGAYAIDAPANAPKGSGNFSWPSAGYVSQGYWGGHPALDIAGWVGSPVTAADGGYVVLAGGGWNGGYGVHVIVDHGNGFSTLYAHLNSVFVSPGMTVSKGQQLGTMGNTGNSTGPHLHLEVRYGGVPYNPANYLD